MQDKKTYIPQARNGFYHYRLFVFSHPDYTVGPGTTPGHAILSKRTARGLYRRSGIGKRCFPHLAPKTELYSIGYTYSNMSFKKKTSSFSSHKNFGGGSLRKGGRDLLDVPIAPTVCEVLSVAMGVN